jgi:hypothetical protein
MLNALKSKSMLIHSSRRHPKDSLQLSVDGKVVKQVRCFKFLGVTINDTLTWSDHIDKVCCKVTRSLHLLRRLSWFLPKKLLLLYLKSYVLPSFDYCDIFGRAAQNNNPFAWKAFLTLAAASFSARVGSSLLLLFVRNLAFVHLLPGESFIYPS